MQKCFLYCSLFVMLRNWLDIAENEVWWPLHNHVQVVDSWGTCSDENIKYDITLSFVVVYVK